MIAQPLIGPAQRISVKSRTFKAGSAYVDYKVDDQFDWLAIVILSPDGAAVRNLYLVPRTVADRYARRDKPSSKTAPLRYYRIDEVERLFGAYRSNFSLAVTDAELSNTAAAETAEVAGLPSPTER